MIDEAISFIEEGRIDKALEVLHEIKKNTLNIAKLGSEHSVVITHPDHASGDLIDAVRFIEKAHHGGDTSAKNIRVTNCMMLSPCIKLFPDWFLSFAGHVGTDEYTRLLYHVMVEFDINENQLDSMESKIVNDDDLIKRELALFQGVISNINQPLPK